MQDRGTPSADGKGWATAEVHSAVNKLAVSKRATYNFGVGPQRGALNAARSGFADGKIETVSKMQCINVSLTGDQVKALLQISHSQIFRLKYLDPKMPGYKVHPGELEAAESAVQVLEAALKEDRFRTPGLFETPIRRGTMQRVK